MDISSDEEEEADTIYEVADEHQTLNAQPEVPTTDKQHKAPSKPPQIVLNVSDLNDLFELISEVASLDNVVVKANQGETVRVFPNDSDTYRAIVDRLDTLEIEFHTYQMQSEKPHRIVVRDLHNSTLNKDIIADFNKLGFEVLHIHNPSSRINKDEKLNIFFINIKPCPKKK